MYAKIGSFIPILYLKSIDIYKSSFFPQTIGDLNSQTDSVISASGCAEDSVTKFTSLVRARD